MTTPNPRNPPADLDVVIVNYRSDEDLRNCLDSWSKHDPMAHGIRVNFIVVNVDPDISTDPDDVGFGAGRNFTWLHLPWNAGFSGACNRGALLGNAPIVSFWNADTALINDDAIPTMMRFFDEHPLDHPERAQRAAIAGPLQTDNADRITHAGIFGALTAPKHRAWHEPIADCPDVHDVRRAITVSGSAYFIRRIVWNELTMCPLYQEVIEPGAIGAMLPTPHFFEETWTSSHAFVHGHIAWYVGTAHVQHLWDQAPKEGGNVWSREMMKISGAQFAEACNRHGIEHDQ